MSDLRLGVIGCGAVTEAYHLPAIEASETVSLAALVDPDEDRARRLAGDRPVTVARQARDVLDRIDAAIVAVPNHLHAPVTEDLLRDGVPVLVEKPMALTGAECREMIRLARERGVVLAVGHMRRFVPAADYIRRLVASGVLGRITRFDFREGMAYGWNVRTDFAFRPETGGGVLADMGVHVLDLLLWWLGEWAEVTCRDDSMGGVEAESELDLVLASGARGVVELSRTRKLRNTYRIEGTEGALETEFGIRPVPTVRLALGDGEMEGTPVPAGQGEGALDLRREGLRVFVRQLDDFAGAVRNGRDPLVTGEEGARAVELVEACYRERELLRYPWVFPSAGATS